MIHAYQGLLSLLLSHPERLGWLAGHAWQWHKGPLAWLAFWLLAALAAVMLLRER
jgi:hypothetical protein